MRSLGDVTSHSASTALAAFVIFSSVIALAALGFPYLATAAFTSVTAAVALVMLFVIQHTQSREESATQLKLDELIRTSPLADDHLVHIESAEDVELLERESAQAAHHASVREDDVTQVPNDVLWKPGDPPNGDTA